MTSQWELDCNRISMIQFSKKYEHWTRVMKNAAIQVIESEMSRQEQKEIDHNGTGYYND